MDCAGKAQRRRRFRITQEVQLPTRRPKNDVAASLVTAVQIRQPYFMSADKIPWPHAPEHRLNVRGTYFVTASTYLRPHHFRGKVRLAVLHRGLLKVAADFGWQLEAWAIFSNHYHFVGHSPADEETAENLSQMLGLLHEKTTCGPPPSGLTSCTSSPEVWRQISRESGTYEKSYLARLNYVHQNPVKHGLVPMAINIRGAPRWFERTATPAQIKSIYRFKTDQLKVPG